MANFFIWLPSAAPVYARARRPRLNCLISLIFFWKKPRNPAPFLISRNYSNAPARRPSDLKKTLIYIRDREPPVPFGKNEARARERRRSRPPRIPYRSTMSKSHSVSMYSSWSPNAMRKSWLSGEKSGERIPVIESKTIQLSRD